MSVSHRLTVATVVAANCWFDQTLPVSIPARQEAQQAMTRMTGGGVVRYDRAGQLTAVARDRVANHLP